MAGCSRDPTKPLPCQNVNPVGALDLSPTWSPSGAMAAFYHNARGITDSSGLYLVDAAGSMPTKLLAWVSLFSPELSWSPDGSRIAMYYQYDIWTIDVADRTLRRWTTVTPDAHWPTWSPDGRYLVYSIVAKPASAPDSAAGLHILDTADGTSRVLLRNASQPWVGGVARWSPDGSSIAFFTSLNAAPDPSMATANLVVVPLDGSAYQQLTSLRGSAQNPQWSPDGQQLFFDYAPASCPRDRSTWVVNADGTGLRQWPTNLGDPRAQFGFPFEVSRDGLRSAFVGVDSSGTAGVIWCVDLSRTNRKQLTRP